MSSDLKLKYDRYIKNLRFRETRDILEDLVHAASSIQGAIEKPSPLPIFGACMSVARVLTGSGIHYYDAFDLNDWEQLVPSEFWKQVAEALKPHVSSREKLGGCQTCVAYYVEMDGAKIAWAEDTAQISGDSRTNIMVPKGRLEEGRKLLNKLLWVSLNSSVVVLNRFGKDEAGFRVEADNTVPAKVCDFSTSMGPYLKLCSDRGIHRNILFHGPPGTGKTTVVRTVIENLGLRAIRIRAEDVGTVTTKVFDALASTFEPAVIVLDDLDRASDQVALLESLESMSRRVNFVFATVNYIDRLDAALKRPGRFDEIIHVTELDSHAVLTILGEYTDAIDLVRHWPVAYIREYVTRRSLIGKEKAEIAMKELQARVEELSA